MQRCAKFLATSRILLDHHRVPNTRSSVKQQQSITTETKDLEYLGYLPSIMDHESNRDKKEQLKIILQELLTKTSYP